MTIVYTADVTPSKCLFKSMIVVGSSNRQSHTYFYGKLFCLCTAGCNQDVVERCTRQAMHGCKFYIYIYTCVYVYVGMCTYIQYIYIYIYLYIV